MRARFLVEEGLEGASTVLPPEEARHAGVRRLQPGERVEVIDGKGGLRPGRLERGETGHLRVRFLGPVRRVPPPAHRLHLAVSPPKGDRMTFLVEKLSELGADALLPVVFHRSVDAGVRPGTGKVVRWRRTARESAKQCGRARLLDVASPRPLEALLRERNAFLRWIVLLPRGETVPSLAALLAGLARPGTGDYLVLAGPEGGFTPEEERLILGAGAAPASLGGRILRIETAALAAAVLFRACFPCEG